MSQDTQTSGPELLAQARPYLTARQTRAPEVRAFIRRVKELAADGLHPTEIAVHFGLTSKAALDYNLQLAGTKLDTRWQLVKTDKAG